MSLNLRSIHSRLRKLERKSSFGSARDFFGKLSDNELWAIVELPDHMCSGDEPEDEIEYFSRALDISFKKAEALVVGLERVRPSMAREFRHLSDEELLELIHQPFESFDSFDDDDD